MASARGWAQLVCTTNPTEDVVAIHNNKFTIGRAKSCDLIIQDNKMVSSNHCFVERDAEGRVWVQDTSTNGTLINGTDKLGSGKRMALNHGDEIHLVYRKKETSLNVAYMFQDLVELEREELDMTQEYSSDTEPSGLLDGAGSPVVCPVRKRILQISYSSEQGEPQIKKSKNEKDGKLDSDHKSSVVSECDAQHVRENQPETDNQRQRDSVDGEKKEGKQDAVKDHSKDEESAAAAEDEENDEFAETLMCIICQDLMHDCISLQPCMHAFCAGCYSEWMQRSNECPSCRMKVERINKNHIVSNLIDAYLKKHPDKKRSEDDIKELDAKNKITRDMLYPQTRNRSDDSEDEEVEASYSDSDSDGNTRASQSQDSLPPGGQNLGPAVVGGLPVYTTFGAGAIYQGANIARPPRTVCRQCPNYVDPSLPPGGATVLGRVVAGAGNVVNRVLGMFNAGDTTPPTTPITPVTTMGPPATPGPATPNTPTPGTSTSADRDGSDRRPWLTPAYVCPPGQVHILCVCCVQPMPDRRHQVSANTALPPMQCSVCYRAFCHAYWGCRKADCLGCLSRFSELNIGNKSLDGIILENYHESQIFKDYLESKGVDLVTVIRECMDRLDSGQYSCPDKARFNVTSNSVLCYACGLRNFRDLAYHYRRDIPQDELPDKVKRRANCYWGKNCRTQKNKPLHAERFNHICEQTRIS